MRGRPGSDPARRHRLSLPASAIAVASERTGGRTGAIEVQVRRGSRYPAGELLEWGSVTKVATARAVATAIAQGLFGYDDELADLIGVPLPPVVTVSRVLAHTSGLPDLHAPARWPRDPTLGVTDDPASLLRDVEYGPADRRRYSNLGYALLGVVLDRQLPGGWEAAVRDRFALPYSLSSLTARPAPERRALLDYWPAGPRAPWLLSESLYRAAGGLWSTLEDLARMGVAAAQEGLPWVGGSAWTPFGDEAMVTGRTRDVDVCVRVRTRPAQAIVVHSQGRRLGHSRKWAMRAAWPASE